MVYIRDPGGNVLAEYDGSKTLRAEYVYLNDVMWPEFLTGYRKCPVVCCPGSHEMKTIGAAKFKEQCLGLLDNLDAEGLVITKHGKPVAKLLPHPRPSRSQIGRLAGRIQIRGDIMSTGSSWRAAGQP